jgi:hypothetical protein
MDGVDHVVPGWLWGDGQGSDRHAVALTLRYRPGDPLAVHLVFPPYASRNGSPVTWTFARDLLAAGAEKASGPGDVRIWPTGRSILARLRAPGGTALLELVHADVERFLRATFGLVPAGGELTGADLDALIDDLRAAPRRHEGA